MAQGIHLRKYGVETTIDFELYEVDGIDLRTDWTPAAADCEVMKDEGASTQCTNTATDEGSTYSIVLTATEMQAARLVLKVVDAATKVFLDKVIVIETYGNASAMHAFDLDTATQGVDVVQVSGDSTAADNLESACDNYSVTRGLTGTALPAAVAAAAGGVPLSTAGSLEMDTLADWVNAGRLDTILDAIKTVTDNLPDSGALTTIGTDTARLTAVRAATMTDWIDGGRLDLLLDAIKVVTDALTDPDTIAAALLDLANGIETGVTLRQAQRAQSAVAAGKRAGGPGTTAFSAINNTGTTRVTSTTDEDGDGTIALNL